MGFLKGTIDATSIDFVKREVVGHPGATSMHKPRFLQSKVDLFQKHAEISDLHQQKFLQHLTFTFEKMLNKFLVKS